MKDDKGNFSMDITKGAVKPEPLLNKMLLLFMLAMILANLGG